MKRFPEIKDLMLDIGAESDKEVRSRGIEIGTQLFLLHHSLNYLNIDIVLRHGIIVTVVS